MQTKKLYFIVITLCVLNSANVFSQSPGTLDVTYGTNGISIANATVDEENFMALSMDNQDRSYVCQRTDFLLTRFLPEGGVDAGYGSNGTASIPLAGLPPLTSKPVSFLVKQDDEKMLVGGYGASPGQLILVRYDVNGQPDASFANNGIFINPSNLFNEETVWNDGVTSPDGSIYALAQKEDDIVIEKLTAAGKIDSSYNDDGIVKKDLDAYAWALALQADGKVLVASASNSKLMVARFKTSGGIDNTFGAGGTFVENSFTILSVTEIFMQADGKIMVVSNSGDISTGNYIIYITRLNSNGSADNTFGINGTTSFPFYRGVFQFNNSFRAFQQSDGKILVSYWKLTDDNGGNVNATYRVMLTCFNQDGSPDNNFGVNGSFTYELEHYGGFYAGAATQSSGKIILAFSYDNDLNTPTENSYTMRLYGDLAPAPTCPLPASVVISDITKSKATVSWTGNEDAYSYRIRKRPVGTTTWIYSSVIAPITSKTLSNNLPGTDYEVQVQTYCNEMKTDSSGYTASVNFTSANVCSGTSSVSTTGITNSSATLNWTYTNAPAKWAIKYKTSNSSNWTTVKISGSLTSYVLSGLAPSTNYDWKINAKCGSENSAWSTVQHFTTAANKLAAGVNETSFSIYPNPAKDQISIQFTLPASSHVNIKVYDVSGKELTTILNEELNEGGHTLPINVSDFSKGIYFVKMISVNGIQNQKLIVQ